MKRVLMVGLVMTAAVWPTAALADDAAPDDSTPDISHPFGLYGSVGASLDHGALCLSAGVRWEVVEALTLGLQAEYNPWYSIATVDAAPGAFNTYVAVVMNWLTLDEVTLHTTVQLGMSVLLFDLVSAPAGSVGPYLGIGLLGATFMPRERLRVVVEAGEVAMPMPNLRGAPFFYRQYRITVGIDYRL